MEFRHLRYFAAVAETLNFGRAAAALHISQPPLSRQIQAFERELGMRLFTRGTRGVRLTAAERALLPEARRLLREAEALVEGAQRLAEGVVGALRIGFISTASYNVLPRVLPEFHRRRPGIRLHLHEATSYAQVTLLRELEIDVGLLVPPIAEEGVRYARLMREPLIAALPAQRRWPRRPSLASLAGEPFILFPRPAGAGLYDLIVGFCQAAGFTPRIGQEAIQTPTIVSLVAAGMGVALVPASLRHMRRTGVVYRPLAETSPLMEVGLAWREGDEEPAVAAFVQHVRAAFRS
ncbi:MAG: LysR family transcriptional regulator [Betaproteobacteria bacterium]